MCGIVGFCGPEDALPYLLDGLNKLEYRGYDSAGVAVANDGKLTSVKTKGRIANLTKLVEHGIKGGTGIGHTRWATHGAPSGSNAHPHMSRSGKFAVVHNGIIENYQEIKTFLIDRSFSFASETDTEVIGHLIDYYYRGDPVDAIIKAAWRLHGSYALAILCADSPDRLFATRKESPLVLGTSQKGTFLASDMSALLSYTRDFIVPEAGEVAILTRDEVKVLNFNREKVEKKSIRADWKEDSAQMQGYSHFMLKEIYEQPRAVRDTLCELGRRIDTLDTLKGIERLHIVACGSAYHAALAAKYFIEKLCRIPVECETASEYRYKNPIIPSNTLAIAVSQSGETADTIAAINEAKKRAKVLSVVNVPGSTIARISDEVIYTLAGPEIAVATTKGYICQVAALYAVGLHLQLKRMLNAWCSMLGDGHILKEGHHNEGYPKNSLLEGCPQTLPAWCGVAEAGHSAQCTAHSEGQIYQPQTLTSLSALHSSLSTLPNDIASLLEKKETFQQLSSRFSFINSAFFIGRGIDYAVAMEGALKLKEISYINAQSYPAGELKHGTISLIEEGTLVVAVATDPALYEKIISNIREVQSRGAVVLAITSGDSVAAAADFYARIPEGINAPLLSVVSLQLFAYYTALARGCDIDKPRNLAKSVTVE
ncbi:MAG: glutamine--fructose-6-phosphate transaminase (isomerizing) [Firmicutes bacterium]|nr:glutamine--fructose-6-phosphate transaminase (isomerizing) [Bacillota bacterium]